MPVQSPGYELGEILISHRKQLHGIARKIVGSAELADDVLQDAYLKLLQGARVREVKNPFYYCCQVVRNVAVDYWRRQSVEASYRVDTENGELPPVPSAQVIDKGLHEQRVLDAIARVLETLPPRIQQVFELYRFAGLTQREIAARLGCSATLVNFMMKEAMAALANCRALLDDE